LRFKKAGLISQHFMKKTLLVLFTLTSTICGAQAGESVYAFLNLPTSPRQIGLGGAPLTLESDVNQPLWNPASIGSEMQGKVAVNFTNYLAGINLGSLTFTTSLHEKLGLFHAGIQYLDYGELTRADEMGNVLGNFKSYDLALSMGYAHALKSLNLQMGVNAKLINSRIDTYSSFGLAFDLAFLYEDAKSPLKISMVLRNIGTQITTFNGAKEALPFRWLLGASSRLKHVPIQWFVTIDNLQQWDISDPNPSQIVVEIDSNTTKEEEISFANNAFRHAVFGFEFFPENKLTLRLGYSYKKARELEILDQRAFNGLSYGFGLKMKNFEFNYALSKFHPSANSNTFGLVLNLDK
jgi:hypothetical protein